MTLRLVFTTSIITPDREQLYVDCIRETMQYIKHIPLKAYVVENNGERQTALDTIDNVDVMYTNTNNIKSMVNKGQKEMLDVLLVADRYGFDKNDIVIKLTGRYTLASSSFFDQVIAAPEYDVYLKCWNVCERIWDPLDCVMGLYACRFSLLDDFDYISIFGNHYSVEKALIGYFRSCVPAERIYEVKHLDMYFQGDKEYCI
jgi:hypothetical protein